MPPASPAPAGLFCSTLKTSEHRPNVPPPPVDTGGGRDDPTASSVAGGVPKGDDERRPEPTHPAVPHPAVAARHRDAGPRARAEGGRRHRRDRADHLEG